jgi:hypothetical protein
MKQSITLAIIFLIFVMASPVMSQTITNFSDWTLYVCPQNEDCLEESGWTSGSLTISGSDWSASLNIDNGKLTFDVDGAKDQGIWVGLYKNFGPQGALIISEVKVNSLTGNGYAGIWHSIEEWPIQGIQEDEVTCEVRVVEWNSSRTLEWKVRERSDDRSYEKVLSRGFFGDHAGEWSMGQAKYLGYAVLMNQMYFWVDGYNSMHTFMPLVNFSSNEAVFDPMLIAYVDRGDSNHINVDFNHVTVQ